MEIFTFCCTYFKMMLMYDILCVSSCYNNIHTSIKNEIGFLPPSHDHIKNMIKPVSLRAKTLPLCASICDDKCPILQAIYYIVFGSGKNHNCSPIVFVIYDNILSFQNPEKYTQQLTDNCTKQVLQICGCHFFSLFRYLILILREWNGMIESLFLVSKKAYNYFWSFVTKEFEQWPV